MLILEVTETTAMSNPDESVRVLTELTNAGVKPPLMILAPDIQACCTSSAYRPVN
jgi:hypothetical protein